MVIPVTTTTVIIIMIVTRIIRRKGSTLMAIKNNGKDHHTVLWKLWGFHNSRLFLICPSTHSVCALVSLEHASQRQDGVKVCEEHYMIFQIPKDQIVLWPMHSPFKHNKNLTNYYDSCEKMASIKINANITT